MGVDKCFQIGGTGLDGEGIMDKETARRVVWQLGVGPLFAFAFASHAVAQGGEVAIEWEVANRFRLFAEQIDFDTHVRAHRAVRGKTVLEVEQRLADESPRGIGWAAGVHRLCYDSWTGRVLAKCRRDGVEEDYLNPKDLRVRLTARLPADFGSAKCTWSIGSGEAAKTVPERDCRTTVSDQRVPTNKAIVVSVLAKSDSGAVAQGTATIEARDVVIVGLGDSTASGEGNPTRPVALNDNGFCFRRVLLRDRDRFFLPGRAKANVIADCPLPDENRDQRDEWEAANAEWLFAACHLSLYSYQARAAIALAVENPSLSVTYYPMGCTGATIREGMLGRQRARERPRRRGQMFPRDVGGQTEQLSAYLGMVGNNPNPARRPDLILLTIGGNDLKFSGLVADLLITEDPERRILIRQKLISGPDDSRRMFGPLTEDFKALRRALLRLTGGSLERVIFVNYGNPAMHQGDKTCPTSRRGVDAHPAFSINGSKVEQVVSFVEEEFLPRLESYATCGAGAGCSDPNRERMTYVDEHRPAFRHHGFCASDPQDPVFDRECFRNGDSFNKAAQGGLNDPLKCGPAARNFRPYTKRARWIRTVNDSYFTAMTYPAMGGLANPADIHDGLWGVASVVYGGAIHPTGEGHAAMADAALPAARRLLGLPAPARDEGSN
jgi:hypothetical protein